MLTILVNNDRVEADKVDSLKLTFDRWLSDKPDLKFCPTTERLDKFYYCLLAGNTTYKDLWEIIRMLLTLSHGQAQVERGFSVNKEIMTTSMKERTLIAQRVICDHVTTVGGLGNVVCTPGMLTAANNTRSAYRLALEEETVEAEKAGVKRKREEDQEELRELKSKRARVEQDARILEDKVDVLMDKAEATKKHSFVVEACSHRRTVKEKRALLVELDQAISKKAKEVGAE